MIERWIGCEDVQDELIQAVNVHMPSRISEKRYWNAYELKLDRHLKSLDLCVKVSIFDSMKTQLRLIFCPVIATVLGVISCGDFTKDGPDPLKFIGSRYNVARDTLPSSVKVVEVLENVDGNQKHHDALVSLDTEDVPANFNQGPVDFIAPELNEFASENDGGLLPPRSP